MSIAGLLKTESGKQWFPAWSQKYTSARLSRMASSIDRTAVNSMSHPSNSTRDYPPSLLIVQGIILPPF